MRKKKNIKNAKATSLDEAIALTKQYAKEHRQPSKVMADLMGVELKTYYRWLLDATMPLNRVPQFERLAGCHFISEYLCVMHGSKVVIDIPRGRRGRPADVARVQGRVAEAIHLLIRFYEEGVGEDEAVAALTETLSVLAFQRENVLKMETPELMLGDENE